MLAWELGQDGLPSSVLTVKRDLALRRRIREWQGERAKRPVSELTKSTAARIRHPVQGKGVGPGREAYSVFPPELVRFFARFYRVPAGGLYVDPFAGQGVRLQTAVLCGLRDYGQDTSATFHGWIERELYPRLPPGVDARVVLGDSRNLGLPSASGDFSMTSPPYWNLEQYPGATEGDLSHTRRYEDFLDGMEAIGRELARVLKPGAFAVANVADIRRDGAFYPYHSDLLQRWTRAGLLPWDVWILRLYASTMAQVFAPGKIDRQIAPKAHEYALVFRAPGA